MEYSRELNVEAIIHEGVWLIIEMQNNVSVITVSYNAEHTIEKTIQSVLAQAYSDYEYIIVDGLSTDATYNIICQYDGSFAAKGIRFFHISESDGGLYDAMNKALEYCRSEWIIYMNANDTFYNEQVLFTVFRKNYDATVSCIYGDTCNIKNGKVYYKKSYPIKCLAYRGAFIHQALFVRKNVLKKYKFDTEYQVSADMDLFVRMWVGGEQYVKVKICIANYDMDGISQNNTNQVCKEWYQIWDNAGVKDQAKVRRWWRMKVLHKLKENPILWKVFFWVHQVSTHILN